MKRNFSCLAIVYTLLLAILLSGCSGNSPGHGNGTWDNTPKVLSPSAPGAVVSGNYALDIDESNIGEGYIMVMYQGSAAKIKFFVITPEQVRYTYDLVPSDSYAAIPLTGGNGTYTFDVREHVDADLYSNLYEESIDVVLNDEFRPFLYPNQYTWFTPEYQCVALASQEADSADTALDVIANVYNYVVDNVSYDEEKALTVQSGYLPNPDETLTSGTGICFDYAALMTAMLRSQGIPTKLEIGYSGDVYHAWISTWTAEQGWIDKAIEFNGSTWTLMDPTLAANNSSSSVRDFVGDGANYVVQYSR